MDHRGVRALVVLAVAIVPLGTLLASGARSGGPPSSMAGPTTFAAIGPTAIPASTWGGLLAVPSPARATPKPTAGSPSLTPTLRSSLGPTSAATAVPTFAASLPPGAAPTPRATTTATSKPSARPTTSPTFRPTSGPTAAPTAAPTTVPTSAPTPNPGACTVFPSDNVWNKRIDDLPVKSSSATLMASIGLDAKLHPDFSSTAWNGGLGYGIPINKVNGSTPTYQVAFDYDDESDPGPYPIPANPKIEGGSDAHLILWDTEGCFLYEIFAASKSGGQWSGGSGAIWDLRSNALRPDGWTSADAAGLPILPGLARYDEVAGGAIRHALRFTAPRTCSNHIYPARHDAGSYSCSTYPPMGLRIRLKASVDISGFGPQARVVLTALKRYGMILADNGSALYVTGAPSPSWNDDDLHDLGQLHGSDFEVVDTGSLRNG